MDSFSSNAEETIHRRISCIYEGASVITEADLVNAFDLKKCISFIQERGFTKVCLQFPDNLLQFAVQVALWLENSLNQKLFVLGDTTYGSCCVDELAAQHIDGDAVIHFGHACLSPTSRLPVMYVLPRATLDLDKFTDAFTQHCNSSEGPVLLLYDVAFSHLIDDISTCISHLKEKAVISQLVVPGIQTNRCCEKCSLNEGSNHVVSLLGRTYCCESFASVVYIAYKHTQNMLNFALTFRDAQFYTYSGGDITTVDFNKTLRRRLYFVEKVKDAKVLGILVGTLSVDSYLCAIERIKNLAAFRGKRSYIFSVGKPNPAKLANFPEIEVYVLISCPEACLESEKDFMQPVVSLLEAELALSPGTSWDDKLSVDFRDLVKSATSLPEGQEPLAPDVSLIVNRIRSDVVVADTDSSNATSTELTIKDQYQISVASSYSAGRSWRGLEQALGQTPVTQAKIGRSGIPLAYEEEKAHQNS
ncbi:2-(3-amino-3-carboxypropyl)histidine synthase subunit 2 [Macrosteles quadrilineatus]|uniref:2-(3-amino-3-carboxypropyl)histidine synthase subunit 2 n=1 Tax=Macrosteles quadrilineatus TaxID=74068 RepID=UPI0023E17367|nr:2-(3-amino-3-carboxypropyl)histidine synthase subunit 2 [Macrosteles quadrilineatus]